MQLSLEEEKLILAYRAEKAKNAWKPKYKEEYSVEEKVNFFDSIYDSALRILSHKEATGYNDDDEPHFAFESMMNILGPGIWEYYNNLIKYE